MLLSDGLSVLDHVLPVAQASSIEKKRLGIWFRYLESYLSKIYVKRPQNLKIQSVHMRSECCFSPGDIFLAFQPDPLGVSNCL